MLRSAKNNPFFCQLSPHRFIGDPNTGLFCQVIGQALQRPHRVFQSQAPRPSSHYLKQLFSIRLCNHYATTWSRIILQSFDPFRQVTLEPTQDSDVTFANNLSNIFRLSVLFHSRAAPSGLSFGSAACLFFGKVLLVRQAALCSKVALVSGSCHYFTFQYLTQVATLG